MHSKSKAAVLQRGMLLNELLYRLDGQLQQLESSIANADPATKELLSKSTALWLKEQSDVSQS